MERKDIVNLEIYQLAMKIGELTFNLVQNWDKLNINTIGYQLIRSSDSISANIAEGYGRYHYKEQRQFCYIARGSLYETTTWLRKAFVRIPTDSCRIKDLLEQVYLLLKRLNAYINYIERSLQK